MADKRQRLPCWPSSHCVCFCKEHGNSHRLHSSSCLAAGFAWAATFARDLTGIAKSDRFCVARHNAGLQTRRPRLRVMSSRYLHLINHCISIRDPSKNYQRCTLVHSSKQKRTFAGRKAASQPSLGLSGLTTPPPQCVWDSHLRRRKTTNSAARRLSTCTA